MTRSAPRFDRRRLLALGGAWFGLTAMTRQELTVAQKKLLEHYTNNDPAWAMLATAAVTEDRERGLLKAAFTPELQKLSGKSFKISGFMTPLETARRTRHFLLTRRSTTCPFCPPNAPTEAVEVMTDDATLLNGEEVVVTGRLSLRASSDAGLFFVLERSVCAPSPRAGDVLALAR